MYSQEDREDRATILALFFAFIPLIIVGCLSRFARRSSTSLQRGFTMSWLAVGILYGMAVGLYDIGGRIDNDIPAVTVGSILVVSVPALGGMVVVGMMLRDFGICTRFT